VAADQAFLDGAEHRRVRFDVDVDIFELSDPLAVTIDECLAVPFADVLVVAMCVASLVGALRVVTGELSSAALVRKGLINSVRTSVRRGRGGVLGSGEVDGHGLVLAAFLDLAALCERSFVSLGGRLFDHQ
jgi:hypothetical protein